MEMIATFETAQEQTLFSRNCNFPSPPKKMCWNRKVDGWEAILKITLLNGIVLFSPFSPYLATRWVEVITDVGWDHGMTIRRNGLLLPNSFITVTIEHNTS